MTDAKRNERAKELLVELADLGVNPFYQTRAKVNASLSAQAASNSAGGK